MQEVTFTLQTITPLFLAGNDHKKVEIPPYHLPRDRQLSKKDRYAWQLQAELRAPSFRGQMRYWQRALVGGIVGTDTPGLQKVIVEEKNVFGSTDQGSAIRIQVSGASKSPQEYRREGSKDNPSGRGYLLWSMPKSGQFGTDNFRLDRCYYPPNTTFTIKLSAKDQNTLDFHKALVSFWFLTNLGSIGSRSRRCAGSLAATPQQPLPDNISQLSFKESVNAAELKTQLQNSIKAARSLYAVYPEQTIQQADFDVLTSNTCNIWILQNKDSWKSGDAVMSDLGLSLQNYRRNFNEAKARSLLGANVPRDNRGFNKLKALEIFGLPLGNNNNRRASPLLLRVTKLKNEYVGLAVLFKTKVENVPLQNYAIIEDWINTFSMKEKVEL